MDTKHQPITTKLEVKPSSGSTEKIFCCHSNLNTQLDWLTVVSPTRVPASLNMGKIILIATDLQRAGKHFWEMEVSARGQWERSVPLQNKKLDFLCLPASRSFIWADCEEEFLSWVMTAVFLLYWKPQQPLHPIIAITSLALSIAAWNVNWGETFLKLSPIGWLLPPTD